MRIKNILKTIVPFLAVSAFAENATLIKSNNHAITLPTNSVKLEFNIKKVNDTIDVFKIKEKEFGSDSKYQDLGDMDGLGLNLKYGLTENLMLGLGYESMDLEYSGTVLTNKKLDTFLRYKLLSKDSLSISFDSGYIKNSANDVKMSSIDAINDMLARVFKDTTAKLTSDKQTLFYDGSTLVLTQDPYISLVDTYDTSLYGKLLVSFKTQNSINTLFGGYKQTKIENKIDSSFHKETDQSLQDKLKEYQFDLGREEGMYFAGFAWGYKASKFIFEVDLEYQKMVRTSCLDYMQTNKILKANISYLLSKNLSFYIGGKVLYSQFNGELPYLYNKYTQTTFDHKYGYASTGLIYHF